jgi:protein SCO1/2
VTRRASLALLALGAIGVVTAGWWALALWPAGPAVPAWVERTRAVCFGVSTDGMPHAGGWLLLVGEPMGMLGFLLAGWGEAVREGVRALGRSLAGRTALVVAALLLCVGIGLATMRVGELAAATRPERLEAGIAAPLASARMHVAAPPLVLLGHRGDTVRLEQFRGRVVLVAFAFGHCETACPLVMHDAMRVVRETPDVAPVLLVVTLDPWRDTPARLPHIAKAWALDGAGLLLGGAVEDVERTLDGWRIARARDPDTGQITHPAELYVIDRAGRLAYVTPSDPARVASLLRGL